MQILGCRDHELRSSEHLPPGIDSADPYYPAVNHARADTLPPTRYTGMMGNEDPAHVAIVSIRFNEYIRYPLC
jgi:hypothetical protein